MRARSHLETAAVVSGIAFIAIGSFLIVFPSAQVVPHHDAEIGRYSLEWVSKTGSRIYGIIAVFLGAGLMWFARWPARGAKGAAIEGYVWELSQELARRFGIKNHYTIDEVTRSAQGASFDAAFIAYAHAIFCDRAEFDGHYDPLLVACTYDDLRAVVSRRYFGGVLDFDAATIVRVTKKPNDEEYGFYDNGLA